jgi:SecD/SecF fusion protein
MKDYSWKIIAILVVSLVGFFYMWPPIDPDGERGAGPDGVMGTEDDTNPREPRLKRGIDLSGGTILVYQVNRQALTPEARQRYQPDQMVASLQKRINAAGSSDLTIRALDQDRIEIILPQADPETVRRIKRQIKAVGQLEFRILANARDVRELQIEEAKRKFPDTGSRLLEWLPIFREETARMPGGSIVHEGGKHVLTMIPEERMRVTGEQLVWSQPSQDERLQPCVVFTLDTGGGFRFGALTERYKPGEDGFERGLAIVLDKQVMSAPVIRERITNSGRITGSFTIEEVNDIVNVLNSGRLPASLNPDPISEDTIGPTLGADTIAKGLNAIKISIIVVPIFMLIYYRFSGLVAVIALILNTVLILGSMGFVQGTFTLPGLAGLALTIGMAVDANVLIFERIREERERGAALGIAIRNGFDRAWLAIFDSNLTTIMTGWILWEIGTDQVKGFALMLMIGLVINLFTAVFVSRVFFDVWFKEGWLKKLTMLHLIKTPSLDYVSKRYYFIAGSIVLIVAGLIGAGVRGRNILDIEFTGGTAISLRLKEPMSSQGVRDVLDRQWKQNDRRLPDAKIEYIRLQNEPHATTSRRFLLRSTNPNQDEVRQAVVAQFGDQLDRIHLTVADLKPIPKADQKKDTSKGKADETAKKAEKAKKDEKAADKPAPPRFAGGWTATLTFENQEPVSVGMVRDQFDQLLAERKVSNPELHRDIDAVGTTAQAAREMHIASDQDLQALLPELGKRLQDDILFERLNSFGSQVAGEAQTRAILAMVLSWAAIVVYLWFRFKNVSYGIAAVVALVHDVLIAFGVVALTHWLNRLGLLETFLLIDDFKVDLAMVAAFMTIIGYSVNDTIVIFDRIREVKGKNPRLTGDMINLSVNQTMSRTLLTSLTVLMVLLVLYIFGGPGIHGFAFAMLVGCLSGTYSTIFIAAPILILFGGAEAATAPSPVQLGAAARAS